MGVPLKNLAIGPDSQRLALQGNRSGIELNVRRISFFVGMRDNREVGFGL